jgi:transcriptional regulator with XRE-family HTH domain
MFKPEHCRAARAVLGWSIRDLAEHSKVNFKTVARFENGAGLISTTRDAIETALHKAEVRIRPDGAVWHPKLDILPEESRAA